MPFLKAGFNGRNYDTGIRGFTHHVDGPRKLKPAEPIRVRRLLLVRAPLPQLGRVRGARLARGIHAAERSTEIETSLREGEMLKPRNSYITVKRDTPAGKSAGGIALVLARDAGEEPAEGTVLAVGPEVTEVSPGQRVLIGHFGGDTKRVAGEDIVLVKEEEILGVIEPMDSPRVGCGEEGME